MKRNLKTVSDFAKQSPFTVASLRWLVFNAASNGLETSGAIIRVGRRVYIDVDGFDAWIVSQNPNAQRQVLA